MSVLARLLPYALAFASSLCIMILELVSSRLVASHVGASLTVWTSVIGIILGGICLGNVLGGWLSDRVDPRRAVGPLFALGCFLTLSTLWVNSQIDRILPSPEQMNWELRTVLVVLIDFLIPATVLGMVGPVVAKMAVEQARRAGSAIGDVYFWGAVGSIAGTLLCGFTLQLYFGTSTITLLVAAALALLAAALLSGVPSRVVALITAFLLLVGSITPLGNQIGVGAIDLGAYRINHLAVAGNAVAVILAIAGIVGLISSRRPQDETPDDELALAPDSASKGKEPAETRTGLGDLAALAFLASLTFMAMEMVAGRLVTRHLGSSIYGWSSVIAVLLAGLSLGNFLGGKIADFISNEKQASWLFLLASILTLSILPLETPPHWILDRFFNNEPQKSLLSYGPGITALSDIGGPNVPVTWPFRILIVVIGMFFLPALSMGTVSPVVAKLAVGRLRRFHRTGSAIGQVYAWGMVGSILGTFLTGFFLIDYLGTKGVVLAIGTVLALGATFLGELFHAVWAGIPLGLCVIAFTPPGWVDVFSKVIPSINGQSFAKMGQEWGVREPVGDPTTTAEDYAWIDESDYYYIKVENEPEEGGEIQRRTLVLDNLIHGYFILNHPERLDYDYEHIYALVAYRAAQAGGQVKFKPVPEGGPGGDLTTPPGPKPGGEIPPPKPAEPSAKQASPPAQNDLGPLEKPTASPKSDAGAPKPAETPASGKDSAAKPGPGFLSVAPTVQEGKAPAEASRKATGEQAAKTAPDAPKSEPTRSPAKTEGPGAGQKPAQGEAPAEKPATPPAKKDGADATVPDDSKDLKAIRDMEKALAGERTRKEPYIPPVESSSLKTLFLGGGAYCFQRHMQFAYPGTSVDVAEIDPAVQRANLMATGLPKDTKIETYLGDARQFVELHQDSKKYDLIFGDAFNDFSVPWHLTTREFNDKIKKMLTPDGVYMINIIDAYLSDAEAKRLAEKEIEEKEINGDAEKEAIRRKYDARARRFGGFVGSWTRTAMLTFGKDNVYIFGTDDPGEGRRETFVVVASMKPLDLKDLGLRKQDPRYYTPRGRLTTPKPYGEADFNAVVNERSRGIVLTDDFAPVENLLAPVAETRGEKDD
jgi:MFS family permease